jgi:hypothetical protein
VAPITVSALLTLASGDHVVGLLLLEIGEADVGDWSRMSVTSQGDVLSRRFGSHFSGVSLEEVVVGSVKKSGRIGYLLETCVVVSRCWSDERSRQQKRFVTVVNVVRGATVDKVDPQSRVFLQTLRGLVLTVVGRRSRL